MTRKQALTTPVASTVPESEVLDAFISWLRDKGKTAKQEIVWRNLWEDGWKAVKEKRMVIDAVTTALINYRVVAPENYKQFIDIQLNKISAL